MKAIVYLFLILSATAFAESSKSLLTYQFKSDTIDLSVPKGMCLVVGQVRQGKFSVNEGNVCTIDSKFKAPTDKIGKYRLLIPAQNTQLYFFKAQLSEIITRKYEFKSGHKVELDFYPYAVAEILEVDKPVIYLYPNEQMDVSIQLKTVGDLTFSYPNYDEGWSFTVTSQGEILDKQKGKTYPYLFWEAKQSDLFFQSDEGKIYGDVVNRKDVVAFLETKLNSLGLNDKEATDFITFWAPRMLKNENILVQFIVDEQYGEIISEMEITPKPDVIRRVFILFSKIQNPQDYEVQQPKEIKEFNRLGFTVIEWGGSEIQLETDLSKL